MHEEAGGVVKKITSRLRSQAGGEERAWQGLGTARPWSCRLEGAEGLQTLQGRGQQRGKELICISGGNPATEVTDPSLGTHLTVICPFLYLPVGRTSAVLALESGRYGGCWEPLTLREGLGMRHT